MRRSVTFRLTLLQMGATHPDDVKLLQGCRDDIERLTRAVTREQVAWEKYNADSSQSNYNAWRKAANDMRQASAIAEGYGHAEPT